MRDSGDVTLTETQPVQKFGAFFKNYALGLSVIVAALPLVALGFDLIPQFNSMKPLLAILGSGSSFFLVSVIFARRHGIARLVDSIQTHVAMASIPYASR